MIKKLDDKLNGQLNKVKILGKNLSITNESDYSFFKNIKLYLLNDEVYVTLKDEAINKIFLMKRKLSEREKKLVGLNPDIRVTWIDGVYVVYANAGRLITFAKIEDAVVYIKSMPLMHRVTGIEELGNVLECYTRTDWYYVDSQHRLYIKCDDNDDGAFKVKNVNSYITAYIKEVFEKPNRKIGTVYERTLHG